MIGGDDGYRDVLLTFSAGLVARRPGEPTERVIARADAALYQAKAAERNRLMLG